MLDWYLIKSNLMKYVPHHFYCQTWKITPIHWNKQTNNIPQFFATQISKAALFYNSIEINSYGVKLMYIIQSPYIKTLKHCWDIKENIINAEMYHKYWVKTLYLKILNNPKLIYNLVNFNKNTTVGCWKNWQADLNCM